MGENIEKASFFCEIMGVLIIFRYFVEIAAYNIALDVYKIFGHTLWIIDVLVAVSFLISGIGIMFGRWEKEDHIYFDTAHYFRMAVFVGVIVLMLFELLADPWYLGLANVLALTFTGITVYRFMRYNTVFPKEEDDTASE